MPLVLAQFHTSDTERVEPEAARLSGERSLHGMRIERRGIGHSLTTGLDQPRHVVSAQYNQAMPLPTVLYSAAQVRALDSYAIETLGVPGYTLMKRAGEAALRYLRSRWPTAYRIVIVCGSGNNGGDGYVLARFAHAAGLTVSVLSATPRAELKGDARHAFDDFTTSGGEAQPFSAALLGEGEVIVDAVLGTGVRGAVRDDLVPIIDAINAAGKPVFALDVPSGLDSDRGVALGTTVRADCTVSFVGLKTGLLIGDGPEYAGTVYFDDLEVTAPANDDFRPRLERIQESEILQALPRRARKA